MRFILLRFEVTVITIITTPKMPNAQKTRQLKEIKLEPHCRHFELFLLHHSHS